MVEHKGTRVGTGQQFIAILLETDLYGNLWNPIYVTIQQRHVRIINPINPLEIQLVPRGINLHVRFPVRKLVGSQHRLRWVQRDIRHGPGNEVREALVFGPRAVHRGDTTDTFDVGEESGEVPPKLGGSGHVEVGEVHERRVEGR